LRWHWHGWLEGVGLAGISMMDRQPGVVWPWICILAFLFLLAAISPPTWAPERPTARHAPPRAPARRPTALHARPAQAVVHPAPALELKLPPLANVGEVAESPRVDAAEEIAPQRSRVAGPALPPTYAYPNPLSPVATVDAPAHVASTGPRVTAAFAGHVTAEENVEDFEESGEIPADDDVVDQEPTDEIEVAAIPAPADGPDFELDLEAEADDAPAATRWRVPAELQGRLEPLTQQAASAAWARGVLDQLDKLTSHPLRADEEQAVLDALQQAVAEAKTLAPRADDASLTTDWLRARYALLRRVEVWRNMLHLADGQAAAPTRDANRLQVALAAADDATHAGDAQGWREFLLLDTLQRLPHQAELTPDDRALAARALARLRQPGLSDDQRAYLSAGPLATLGEALRPWAVSPADARRLLEDIEQYEQDGLPSDARAIALASQSLALSPLPEDQHLAQRIEQFYRIPNVRLAVTEELLNRMMPKQSTSTDPVRTTILGLPVRGQSHTSTSLSVKLLPDGQQLRFELHTRGDVESSTRSSSGPVELFNDGWATFRAKKVIEVGPGGIRTLPTVVDVDSVDRLRNVRSNFDNVPILGSIVRDVARREYDEQKAAARRESEQKIADQARRQIDETVDARFQAMGQRIDEKVMTPLRRMSLEPTWLLNETTDHRLVVRARLAGDMHLAAHTPRPRAYSDSLASVQLHQSALNNAFSQMGLAGKTWPAPELFRHIGHLLNLPAEKVPENIPASMRLTFAARDGLQATCRNGRIELCVRLDELEMDGHQWRDLVARAFYVPEKSGRTVRLVRDGTVQLSAQRLTPRSQIMLRGLFSRIFARDEGWTLLEGQWETNPGLKDAEVSQFEIEDGWINIAIGPVRPGVPATARAK
jgi:hypothetical protein